MNYRGREGSVGMGLLKMDATKTFTWWKVWRYIERNLVQVIGTAFLLALFGFGIVAFIIGCKKQAKADEVNNAEYVKVYGGIHG